MGAIVSKEQACSCSRQENHCRFFLCACCRRQILLCSRCDRGQRYCSRDCSSEVRRRNQREARARYQATPRGRELHAERSRRYRSRRRVTDQGPAPQAKPAVKADQAASPNAQASVTAAPAAAHTPALGNSCHCCGKPVSAFVRLSWIRRRPIGKTPCRPPRRHRPHFAKFARI